MRTSITVSWTGSTSVQIALGGRVETEGMDRLRSLLELVVHAAGTDVVVDLSRLEGPSDAVLDALAEACRRLWLRRGSMRLVGLGDRLGAPGSGRRLALEAQTA